MPAANATDIMPSKTKTTVLHCQKLTHNQTSYCYKDLTVRQSVPVINHIITVKPDVQVFFQFICSVSAHR